MNTGRTVFAQPMDLRGSIPCFIRITQGKTRDVTILDQLVLEPGAFYILDRGYIDFGRLHTFTQSMAFFITRAKSNLDFVRRASSPVDRSTGLRSDQTIVLHGPRTSQLAQQSVLRYVTERREDASLDRDHGLRARVTCSWPSSRRN